MLPMHRSVRREDIRCFSNQLSVRVCANRGEYFVYSDDNQPPEVQERQWRKQDFHYDDVMMAMLTLFAVQTGEGWPT